MALDIPRWVEGLPRLRIISPDPDLYIPSIDCGRSFARDSLKVIAPGIAELTTGMSQRSLTFLSAYVTLRYITQVAEFVDHYPNNLLFGEHLQHAKQLFQGNGDAFTNNGYVHLTRGAAERFIEDVQRFIGQRIWNNPRDAEVTTALERLLHHDVRSPLPIGDLKTASSAVEKAAPDFGIPEDILQMFETTVQTRWPTFQRQRHYAPAA